MFRNKKKFEALEQKILEILETQSESARIATLRECKTQELESKVGGVIDRLDKIDSLMEGFKEYEENKRVMKNSDEPWADFMTELGEDGRVKVKLDWNKAMIQELRRMGFNAQTEEDIVSAYFSRLVGEHGESMTHEELEEIKNA